MLKERQLSFAFLTTLSTKNYPGSWNVTTVRCYEWHLPCLGLKILYSNLSFLETIKYRVKTTPREISANTLTWLSHAIAKTSVYDLWTNFDKKAPLRHQARYRFVIATKRGKHYYQRLFCLRWLSVTDGIKRYFSYNKIIIHIDYKKSKQVFYKDLPSCHAEITL